MDAYQHQRRFAGAGDAPPPPPHPSHPSAQWYPAPPLPYHPPHPGHPYPPQHHHQWAPPPDMQHQHHPPLPQPYVYQPPPPPMAMQQQPPPPPGNPWPPHHGAGQHPPPTYPPPPPGQAWTNHSWAQNHGYQGHDNEEDWATKAKAWVAAKSVMGNHQIQQHAISTSRTEGHHNGYHDQYQQPAGLPTEVTEALHPPVPQSSIDHVPFPMTGQQRETNHLLDRGPMVSPAKNFGSFSSTYEQEVSYNYSSAPGTGNNMLQYPNSQAQPFPTTAAVQGGFSQGCLSMPVPLTEQPLFGHERQPIDPSDQPLEFNSRKAPDLAVHINVNSNIPAPQTLAPNHDVAATSTHSWTPSATVGYLPRAPVPPQTAQMDPSVHAAPLFGAASSSSYVSPAAFGVGNVTEVFPTDPNTPFSVADKSKKPPVPNWLREELLKKKSEPLSASAQNSENLNPMEANEAVQTIGRPDQSDSRSNDSAKSTEDDDDDEDEIEAARMAAINKEIKPNEATGVFGSKETGLGRSRAKASAKVVLPAKSTNSSDHKDSTGLSSPKGALLGLASYDSDDDDDADTDSKDKMPISNLSSKDNAGAVNTEGDKSTLGKRNGNHNEQNSSLGSSPSGEDLKSNNQNFQRNANAEPEQMHIRDTENGEFRFKAKTRTEPKGAFDRMDEKAHTYAEVDIQNRKTSFGNNAEKHNDLESSHRHSEKSSKEDFVNELKADHTKELEYSRAEKYNNDDKYSMYGNIDKRGSCKEGKGSDSAAKHESDTREPHYRGNSKLDGAKGDWKDLPKDRERNRDDRRGKGKDEKDDRLRQMTSHNSRSSRSRSPRGRSRTRKENSHVRGSVSSDEPSDSVKKRRISRSPHSKHSHRRHSPYSSAGRFRMQTRLAINLSVADYGN
ncbi:cyclin-related [Zea mays]|uniref:Cyclin-related n=1 Tax=Zea mays TaxID=4577 RepID=A0A1D6DUY1_MAIZE|nr:cyclin-related [Zea mays]